MSWESVVTGAAVGRDADLSRVASIIDGSGDGTPGAILVVGQRGVGRTSLLNAATARTDVRPLRLLALACQSSSDYAGLTHALTWTAAPTGFASLVGDWLDVLARPDCAAPELAGQQLLTRTRSAALPTSLTIEIDDVHLLDRASQQVVAYIALHGAAAGLRSVLSADEAADLTAFAGIERFTLRPLDVPELRVVLEQETADQLPFRTAELIHTWSGGNPALALDLVGQLGHPERHGLTPVGLPLLPTTATVERLGQRVAELSVDQQRVLAVFARFESLPADVVQDSTDGTESTLDQLVTDGWLTVSQGSVEPCRRADAVMAWAGLVPSVHQDLHRRFAEFLGPGQPALADYFAALCGNAAAHGRLVGRAAELIASGRSALAAAALALVLRHDLPALPAERLLLAAVLTAEGYVSAAVQVMYTLSGSSSESAAVSLLWAELAAIRTDPADAEAQLDVSSPPSRDLDAWLTAVFTVCRLQLGLDGPAQSAHLLTMVNPTLPRATPATQALAGLVDAEREVYHERPGAAAVLRGAVERWTSLRSRTFDLSTITAAFDLLGLGQVAAARDLVASVGPTQQLTFATARSAVLTVRVEADIAAGQYRRAGALLVELDRQLPSPSGADLVITSQAIRIGAVCDDLSEPPQIERRLIGSPAIALSYASRRAHTAALGFRELVRGNLRHSRDLLALALQGPALLLQGRSCVLADLIEATVADGSREEAAALLAQHSGWLPDQNGERSRGLLARCRALVAAPDEVDAAFAAALLAHDPSHETDRARTLLAYGRTLLAARRAGEAQPRLTEAAQIFRELRLPGWLRHVQQLEQRRTSPSAALPVLGSGPTHLRPIDSVLTNSVLTDSVLTDLEREIVDLVMQRKRNREIAAALYVSLRTVEGHLTRIFRKLGVSTKAQLFARLSGDASAREPA